MLKEIILGIFIPYKNFFNWNINKFFILFLFGLLSSIFFIFLYVISTILNINLYESIHPIDIIYEKFLNFNIYYYFFLLISLFFLVFFILITLSLFFNTYIKYIINNKEFKKSSLLSNISKLFFLCFILFIILMVFVSISTFANIIIYKIYNIIQIFGFLIWICYFFLFLYFVNILYRLFFSFLILIDNYNFSSIDSIKKSLHESYKRTNSSLYFLVFVIFSIIIILFLGGLMFLLYYFSLKFSGNLLISYYVVMGLFVFIFFVGFYEAFIFSFYNNVIVKIENNIILLKQKNTVNKNIPKNTTNRIY